MGTARDRELPVSALPPRPRLRVAAAGLESLQTQFETGELRANRAGRDFVVDQFGDEKVARGLRRLLAGEP